MESDDAGDKYHVVVLEDALAQEGAEEVDTIEINAPNANCNIYKKCEKVENIVIGTDSENPEFIGFFDEVVANFRVSP